MSKIASLGCLTDSATPSSLERFCDEELMGLVQEHSQAAFALLYDRHGRLAFAAALRICGERALAEDAVQEAFLSVWRGRWRYDRRRGNVRGWIMAIARNRAIDVLRRAAHDRGEIAEEAIEEWVEALERTDDEAGRREQARELRCALELLPVEQSSVIELAFYGGYTQVEIATMLGTPVGTIKGRMRLGLQKMRTELLPEQVFA
jgi:RNA polymerase sigma-70 factor (ECF subfamily)